MTPQPPRLCLKCGDPVLNHQPARITREGTSHIGGCDPGAAAAMERMREAFFRANKRLSEVRT